MNSSDCKKDREHFVIENLRWIYNSYIVFSFVWMGLWSLYFVLKFGPDFLYDSNTSIAQWMNVMFPFDINNMSSEHKTIAQFMRFGYVFSLLMTAPFIILFFKFKRGRLFLRTGRNQQIRILILLSLIAAILLWDYVVAVGIDNVSNTKAVLAASSYVPAFFSVLAQLFQDRE